MVIIYTNIFCNEALKNKDTVSSSTEKDQTGQLPPDTAHGGSRLFRMDFVKIYNSSRIILVANFRCSGRY